MADDCTITLSINAEDAVKNITTVEKALEAMAGQAERAQAALSQIGEGAGIGDLASLQSSIESLTSSMSAGFAELSERMGMVVNNTAAGAEGTITYLTAINEQLANIPVGETEQASESVGQMAQGMESAAAGAASMSSNFMGMITGILKKIGVFALLYKAIQKIIGLTQEGFKNMTKYSQDYRRETNELKNSMETLKLQLAGAFEPIVTMIIPYIVKLVDWLTIAADKMAQFLAVISGRSTYNKAIKQMRDFAAEAEGASNSLASFDQLNVIGNGGNNGPWWQEAAVDSALLSKWQEFMEKLASFQPIFEHLGETFKNAFDEAFTFDGRTILNNVDSIRKSFEELANDKEIQGALFSMLENVAGNAGTTAGSIAKFGQNIAKNATGGMAKWLNGGGKEQIKKHVINAYNQISQASDLIAAVSEAGATISDAFASENGTNFTANLYGATVEPLWMLVDDLNQISLDITDALTTPFTDNAGGFEIALESFLGDGATILEGAINSFRDLGETWDDTYTNKIQPVLTSFKETLSEVTGQVLNTWNQYVSPVLDNLAQKLKKFSEGEGGQFVKDIMGFLSEVGQTLLHVLSIVSYAVGDILNVILPPFMRFLSGFFDFVINMIGDIMTFLGGFLNYFEGMFEVINGIFTGNMDLVEEGLDKMLQAGWKMVAGFINAVIDAFGVMVEGIVGALNGMIRQANNIPGVDIPLIPNDFTDSWGVPTTIPWLANGGVTTGSTMAMIGEAGKEAVLPLERDTGWADIVADKLSERMGGGDYTFVAQLDGKTIFNETVKQNRMYQRATGHSAFGY